VIRYAGDAELLRALVAAGSPVVVQQQRRGSDGAHFRTVNGYSAGLCLISDPLLSPALRPSADRLAELWAYHNGAYLVAFPPAKAADVQRILGSDYSAAANWQHLQAHGAQDVKARPQDQGHPAAG